MAYFSFFFSDTMHSESAFDVIDESEEFVGLLNGDYVHEASWISHVSSDFAVDFDETLSADLLRFGVCQSVFETVSQEDNGRQAFTQFVWTWTRFWCKHPGQFVQHPLFWCIQTFQMFPSSAVLFKLERKKNEKENAE